MSLMTELRLLADPPNHHAQEPVPLAAVGSSGVMLNGPFWVPVIHRSPGKTW